MYDEHGKYVVTVEGNLIIVTLEGSFNDYGIKKCIDQIKGAIEGLEVGFYMLMKCSDMMGSTPESFAEVEKFNKWLNTQNMIAKAMVLTYTTTWDIINTRVPSIESQNIRSFDNESEAMDWLMAQS